MPFDQGGETQVQAARIAAGVAMAGFLAAGFLRRLGRRPRIGIRAVSMAGILGFIACLRVSLLMASPAGPLNR
ncbi:MAG TPA: hypothetical protein VGC09_19490 [Rhodopila sp.]